MRSIAWRLRVGAEILAIYVRVRWVVQRGDIRGLTCRLRSGESDAAPTASDVATAARLGRAVARVLAFSPKRSRCLVQSLVLTRVLAKRGIASSLVIGVTAEDGFGAHAWVEAGGRPLLPHFPATYEPLARI